MAVDQNFTLEQAICEHEGQPEEPSPETQYGGSSRSTQSPVSPARVSTRGLGKFASVSDMGEKRDSGELQDFFKSSTARHELLQAVIESNITQTVSAALILLTVLLICLDTNARAKGSRASLWEEIAMTVCFIAYAVEFSTTVYVEGRQTFRDHWSYMDALVIFSGLVHYALTLGGAGDGFSFLRMLRILRLLRLGRLMKKLKLMQRVPWLKEQYILCMMMASCLRTLLWAFILCFFVMTLWSIVAVELLNDKLVEMVRDNPELWSDCSRCRHSFSSIWDANWTFFQTIVAGDSWGMVALPVIDKHPWSAGIFVGALSTIIFGILSLISAVVIDTFAERRAKDISSMATDMEYEEAQEKKQLEKIFQQIDEDGSGALSMDELYTGAEKVREFRQYLRVLDIDDNDLAELFAIIDEDGSGEVDPTEFIEALYRMKHTDPKTATRFVKHMVGTLFDKQIAMKDGIDGIQENVLERLSSIEARLVSDLEETASRGTATQEKVHDLIRTHTKHIDEFVSKAIENAASVTLNAAMDAAVAKASQAIRQVVTASANRTAAISDRVSQICSQSSDGSFSRQITPLSQDFGGISQQVTPVTQDDSHDISRQPQSDSSTLPQPEASRKEKIPLQGRKNSPTGKASSFFKIGKANLVGPPWVASRPVILGVVDNDMPCGDMLYGSSFGSMTTQSDARIRTGMRSPRNSTNSRSPKVQAVSSRTQWSLASCSNDQSSSPRFGSLSTPASCSNDHSNSPCFSSLRTQAETGTSSSLGPKGPQGSSSAKVLTVTTASESQKAPRLVVATKSEGKTSPRKGEQSSGKKIRRTASEAKSESAAPAVAL